MTTESLAAKVGQVISGLFGRSSAGNTEIPAAATFANRKWNTPQEDGKDKVQLVLTKNWADFNNQFGTRPDTLDLTLERRADAQPGQSNAIAWTTVTDSTPTDSTPTEDKPVTNQWKYIWSGLDRYAEQDAVDLPRQRGKTSGLSGVRKRQCPVWQHETRPRQQRS